MFWVGVEFDRNQSDDDPSDPDFIDLPAITWKENNMMIPADSWLFSDW